MAESIEALSAIHVRGERAVGRHQRFVERVTDALGRPALLYGVLGLVALWMMANLAFSLLGARSFDRPPFFWLQGMVALSSLVMSSLVLIAQNRQLKLAEKRTRLDLEIGLLVERKVGKVIALLEELRRDLPNVHDRHDPEAAAMRQSIDPHALAEALDARIEEEVGEEQSK